MVQIYDKNPRNKQSQRKEIYQAYAKSLIQRGLAYPCFCTPEELEEIRTKQETAKLRPGYYGIWAKYRNLPIDEEDRKIKHKDVIKGNIEFPENDQDIVIIKADGLPTYHFAHAIDDHLMRTTHVIRGDEWVSSIPLHLELFKALGFKPPKYAHTATIMKDENGSKRKISKRKDPEAAVSYYHEEGIPEEAVVEYLLKLELNKMSVSGAVFDMVKLLDVSKNVISKFTAEKIYDETLKWAKRYDKELETMLTENKDYAMKILNIERGGNKPRKDISKWSEVKNSMIYMYDDKFANNSSYEFQNITDSNEIKEILNSYLNKYFDIKDDKQTWFDKMKDLAEERGYAREVKEYKANPENYKGHVGDISTVIRVALTGRHNTPDLYEIMQILGKDSITNRINKICGGN